MILTLPTHNQTIIVGNCCESLPPTPTAVFITDCIVGDFYYAVYNITNMPIGGSVQVEHTNNVGAYDINPLINPCTGNPRTSSQVIVGIDRNPGNYVNFNVINYDPSFPTNCKLSLPVPGTVYAT